MTYYRVVQRKQTSITHLYTIIPMLKNIYIRIILFLMYNVINIILYYMLCGYMYTELAIYLI